MRIAFLTSFNSDFIKTEFQNYLLQKEIAAECWWNLYGLHEESVYNTQSTLYEFNPELIFVHVEVESFLGDFILDLLASDAGGREKYLENSKAKLNSLMRTLCTNFPNSKIIIQNFVQRIPNSLGLLDSNIEFGLSEFIYSLNLFLLNESKNYSGQVVLQDFYSLVSKNGINQCYDSRLYRLIKYPFTKSFSEELIRHYFKMISSLTTPRKKCIVVDLDNTLWGGIIGQDGFDNVELGSSGLGESYKEFQKVLLNYHRRGIILAVCSKNNYDDAIEVIEKHTDMILRKEHFSMLQINWLDKSTNLNAIANQLNIGIDSLVFMDNDPAECELVRQQLPEVLAVHLTGDPDNYIKQLLSIESLESTSLTMEDSERIQMYRANIQRKETQNNFSSLVDYYQSLEMKAFININNELHISRIAQLTQKTNQFNLSTHRYTNEEIRSFMNDGEHLIYSLRLADKFGDNGIVASAIVKKTSTRWFIDSFMMSCRIIGRHAETALLNIIIEEAMKNNVTVVSGEFIATKKNIPAADFYSRHNFVQVTDTKWRLDLPATIKNHQIEIILEN